MTALALSLASLSVFLFAWSYLVYPALISQMADRCAFPQSPSPPVSQSKPQTGGLGEGETGRESQLAAPSIDVLVSAADEEESIGPLVASLLAQDAPGSLSVVIGCDGCRDRTAELARAGLQARGRVVEFETRRGKAAVVNDLVRQSTADLLVFTDANTRFEPGAVRLLAEAFADPAVGAVCGRLVLEAGPGETTPETLFWDRETESKEAEGRLGVCLGANGAIYAARRSSVEPLPAGSAMDDFLIPARIARAGSRVVFAGGAVAREAVAPDVWSEVSRRFRLGAGAGQVLRGEPWLWSFRRHPRLSFAFVSRKAARWLAPVLAVAAALAALGSPRLFPWAAAALAVVLLAVCAARLRPRLPGLAGRLYYFAVINAALAAGVCAGLAGHRRPAWRRTAR